MGKQDRFIRTFNQGVMNIVEIWVDRETGVNYIYLSAGNGGGLTALLDREGKPIITPIYEE